MSTFDNLPVVLVSTATQADATSLLSELIDDDVTAEYNKEAQCADRVWRLVNKYYSADVRVHTLTDDQVLNLDLNCIEAHIIHITEDEMCSAVEAAGRRAEGAGAAWARAGVRVVVGECARHAALGAWSGAARAEWVPRREPPRAAPPAPFAPGAGLQRARAALHAHVWPSLRAPHHTHHVPEAESASESGASSESEGPPEWEGGEEEEERRCVERAEQFAAALGALGAAPRGAGLPALPRAARLDHAERLVQAFCRALALDPDL